MELLKEVFNNFKEVYDGRTATSRRLDSFRNQPDNWVAGGNRGRQSSKKAIDAKENYAASNKRY